MSSVGLILLAAGASTRLGSPKQLLSFKGRSLLRGAAETALLSRCRPVIVVLGSNAERLAPELHDLNVVNVVCLNWAVGMGASIHTGIAALQAATARTTDAPNTGVLLTLCDQPLLTSTLYDRFIEAHEHNPHCPLVAAEYNSSLGVPALFHHSLYPELRALPQEAGSKRLLQRLTSQTLRIPVPEAAVDVDTPTDYAKLMSDKTRV